MTICIPSLPPLRASRERATFGVSAERELGGKLRKGPAAADDSGGSAGEERNSTSFSHHLFCTIKDSRFLACKPILYLSIMSSSSLEDRLQRWASRLASVPSLALPTDYPRPAPPRVVEAKQSVALSSDHSDAISQLQKTFSSQGVAPSPYQLLLTAFILLLHRYTPDPSLVVCTSFLPSGQTTPVQLLLLINISAEETFESLLKQVIEVEKEAQEDAAPLEDIERAIKKAQPERGEGPLFRVRFVDGSVVGSQINDEGMGLETDLMLVFNDQSAAVDFSFNSLLFNPARSQHLLQSLLQLVKVASTATSQSILTLPLLTPAQEALLPDPSADLDWCGFKGAIPHIFAANAAAHPDRACVIESFSLPNEEGPSTGRNVFTYKTVDEASNIVAHRLLEAGLQRGEVVMIYAGRRVELVVAVMGVLKAGCIFSVIDPAYPPSRQTVYLDVSTPRALIILEEAGTLHQIVQDFVANSLKQPLRLIVPALKLQPSGQVLGGAAPGASEDILSSVAQLASKQTGVVLGPDSLATLSFTSGSTGIPKGVKGRHYSLTHFFPWMGTRFGLDSTAKYTMLSGIAHDPIQRDSEYHRGPLCHCLLLADSLSPDQSSLLCSSALSFTFPPRTTSELPDGWPSGWLKARSPSPTSPPVRYTRIFFARPSADPMCCVS